MGETISFTVADLPPVDPGEDESETPASGLACVVCGKALKYGGRGRKPKFCDDHKTQQTSRSSGVRRSGRDVDAAMAALDASHTSLSFMLMIAAPDAAVAWEGQRASLDDRNRRILEADPTLAKRLATMAAKGGGASLIISHLIAVAPAAVIVGRSVKSASRTRAERKAAIPVDEPEYFDPNSHDAAVQDLFAR